jgi:TPR repeat protein
MKLFTRNGLAGVLTLLVLFAGTPQSGAELDIGEIRKAAEQGDADAQYQLGVMYGKGEGVAKNNVNAYAWSSLAATQGEEIAARNRESIATTITPEQRRQAEALASELELQTKSNKPVKRSLSMQVQPSSSQPSIVADQTELRAWLQSIKPAAGGK